MRHFTHHAAERAWERYGIVPTEAEWARAVADIISVVAGGGGPAILLRRDSDGERWLVRVAGEPVVAIYQPRAALIVTLLPPSDEKTRRPVG